MRHGLSVFTTVNIGLWRFHIGAEWYAVNKRFSTRLILSIT